MSELSLTAAVLRAEQRLGSSSRKRRSDRGRSRLAPKVEARLSELLQGRERPSVTQVHAALARFCARRRLRTPSRATVYNGMDRVASPLYGYESLPVEVRRALHNVLSGAVPGHQIVFAVFNQGEPRALSFAAGMPWICLHHAARVPGFRPKSLALLRAVMAYRGI